MSNQIDLTKVFGAVLSTLESNQQSLNQADSHNHDHGDNMVKIFNVITQAVGQKQSAPPAEQFSYASEQVRKNVESGSAAKYADGLAQAAEQFTGHQVTANDAIALVQLLLGAGQAEPVDKPDAGEVIGSFLSGLTGEQEGEGGGLELDDLMNAGLAFLRSKQSGESTQEALIDALVAGSDMGSGYRSQSGKLVTDTIISVISNMAANR